MKLHEIIAANEVPTNAILIELLIPYKKSLLTYYKSQFCCEPLLMVTSVSNAVQYGKIIPSDNFHEALNDYLNTDNDLDPDSEDYENEFETIRFNSIFLENLYFNSILLKDL